MGRKLEAADRQVAEEVGWNKKNNGLEDGKKSVRSDIGAHRRWGEIREVSHWQP